MSAADVAQWGSSGAAKDLMEIIHPSLLATALFLAGWATTGVYQPSHSLSLAGNV